MHRRQRPENAPAEDGFTLVELVVALALIAVVATGFTISVGLGFRTIAVAKQRTTASEIATARLEHLRNVPYDLIALSSAPSHAAAADHPNNLVSTDAKQYDVSAGAGQWEDLIVDTDDGSVLHLEDPVQVGSTIMEIYQYVTWVDDPAITGSENYKRVTVVVRYKAPAASSVNRLLRMSTLLTPGTVTYTPPTSPPTTAPGATTTTLPGATTTTLPAGDCTGDVAGPTGGFTIGASGDAEVGFSAGTNVTLQLSFSDPCPPVTANFSNDGVTFGEDVPYDSASPQISWSLSAGDGTKTIHGTVRDGVGNATALSTQSVVLDTTAPTVPGTLLRSVSCSGLTRAVSLAWSASIDVNLRGYRVYRSTDNVTWTILKTSATTSAVDSHSKNLDSVRYRVTAYDKAGNESAATNVVALSKNQCS